MTGSLAYIHSDLLLLDFEPNMTAASSQKPRAAGIQLGKDKSNHLANNSVYATHRANPNPNGMSFIDASANEYNFV